VRRGGGGGGVHSRMGECKGESRSVGRVGVPGSVFTLILVSDQF